MVVTITTDLPKSAHLSEIYQDMNIQQALLKKVGENEFERITAFVKCRDFLVDTYSFSLAKKDLSIYGFSFAGSKKSPDWNSINILMKFPSGKEEENFLEHLNLLREIEKTNKVKETEVIQYVKNQLVITGDRRWLASCLSFSFYSLLLRVLGYSFVNHPLWIERFGLLTNTDAKYIASVDTATWYKILESLSILDMQEWCGLDPCVFSVGEVHHNSGIISVLGHHTEITAEVVRKNKHWQKFKEMGLKLATN